MPLRQHFQQLVDRLGAEALSRPDIDELLTAEGAFDALPAFRFITRAAAGAGVFAALARDNADSEEARRLADRLTARTGLRSDMVASVLEAALEALGKPAALATDLSPRPYHPIDSEARNAAEPMVPYGELKSADPVTDPAVLASIERAIEIRRDNEARRGARIANPACVLADRDSFTITFELERHRAGRAAVAVARYAVYDTSGRVADTDYAGDITPGDTNPLPVKRTIPVAPSRAARVVLFLD